MNVALVGSNFALKGYLPVIKKIRHLKLKILCNRKISKLQQSSWGIGVEESDFGVDYTFTGSGDLGSVSMDDYGVTAMTTTFDHHDNTDNQMVLNFPMTEEEEYANAGYSKEHIKQMQDPRHNQWGAAGEPKKN